MLGHTKKFRFQSNVCVCVCVCFHICVHLPDAASGENMSIPPPSSAGATQPLSFSQKSLWSGVSRVLSDRKLPEGFKLSDRAPPLQHHQQQPAVLNLT